MLQRRRKSAYTFLQMHATFGLDSQTLLVDVSRIAVNIFTPLSFPRFAWERKCLGAPRRLPKDAERPRLAFRRRASEREVPGANGDDVLHRAPSPPAIGYPVAVKRAHVNGV